MQRHRWEFAIGHADMLTRGLKRSRRGVLSGCMCAEPNKQNCHRSVSILRAAYDDDNLSFKCPIYEDIFQLKVPLAAPSALACLLSCDSEDVQNLDRGTGSV